MWNITMAKTRYEFTPTQYKNKYYDEYAEFGYYWSFKPYKSGDGLVGLVLNVEMLSNTSENGKFESYLDFTGLKIIIDELVSEYEGDILQDGKSFMFYFSRKKCMLNFIKVVSETLNKAGIQPSGKIDRCSSFPSAEYATDMFSYVLNDDCSLKDIEDCMLDSAGLYGAYDEYSNFMGLPITSKQKFRIHESTDTSYYLDNYDKYLREFEEKKSAGSIPNIMKEKINKYNKSKTVNTPTDSEISDDYLKFSKMWF